jgi:Leu/Phe-tRNA-protein transferase
MSAATTTTVFGIADCHGIESMFEKNEETEKQGFILNMRVMSNRQRHAVLYEADLNDETLAEMNRLLHEEKDYIAALNYLKENADELRGVPGQENSWDLIPNPKLDPWG